MSEPYAKFVQRRFRELRNECGLTQEELSWVMGMAVKYYQNLETGRSGNPTIGTIERIGKTYDLSIHQFFFEKTPSVKLSAPAAKKLAILRKLKQ